GPAVYDNTLYLGDLSSNLYALDLDGREIWTLPSGTELTPNNPENKNRLEGMIRAQPLVTEDRIYLATGAGKLYALDRATHSHVWTFTSLQGGEQFLTTPVLVGETLLVAPVPSGASPVYLYAINAVSGNAQWLFPPRQEQ
ncbi:MAG TPA: PQQ-binding-like beta-propeller repeat protein, partial [Anaerolineae bacterium]|nr:PQQ-binding-like beta-propeller repeat protein [Anaerolineae bacterium]